VRTGAGDESPVRFRGRGVGGGGGQWNIWLTGTRLEGGGRGAIWLVWVRGETATWARLGNRWKVRYIGLEMRGFGKKKSEGCRRLKQQNVF